MMPAPLLRPHVPLGSNCSIAESLARLRGASNECEAAIAASRHDFVPLLPGCINPVLQPRCVFSDIVLAGRVPSRNRQSAQARAIGWRAPPAYMLCAIMLCAMSTAHDVRAPLQLGGDPTRPLNQLLEADLVYVRDVVHPDGISSDQLKHLCLIVNAGHGSFDLAGRCVALMEQRKELPAGALQQYVEILRRRP